MPILMRVEADSGIAITKGSGVLGIEDAREGVAQLWKNPEWAGKSAVWDFREAEFDLSSSDTREIAQFILQNQPTPPPSKVAFVTKREVDFGMARMFEAYRDDPETEFRVFRDFDEAIRWSESTEPSGG